MKWIISTFIIFVLVLSGCTEEVQDTSTTGDESVSGVKGKVPVVNGSYKDVAIECENLGLGSNEEWEARGFVVEEDIAKNYKGEFDITQQKICKDTDSVNRCRQKCSEMGGELEGINIEYEIITCGCKIY